ncbi:alpha-L-fucosidase [Carboxylicivirga marina]|uniref:alpha-L-fucosidase n=1 Tax=Carboxylicivirga marina TaxID=2800988 RepID=UPI0025945B1A|nr:alpha-L-fucosidase [uncultured Carboxylicivirga sp.]
MSYFLKLFIAIALSFYLLSCNGSSGNLMELNSTIEINDDDSKDSIILKAAHVIPTSNQFEALKNEYIAFIHFGPNTFTRMEWGSGMEDPASFDLQNLDTDQWCEAMVAGGMKMVILTVKHHDGFCLWQSRYTTHGTMSSPYKNGKGDVLKELSESCAKYGLKLGVYLSPADLYQIENERGLYGNLSKYTERVIPRRVDERPFENQTTFKFIVDDYNEYFLNQLFELLTEYGPIHEVWFDGAHPKRKGGQQYNYLAWKELIQTLAPEAVVFGKQDIRWCGNEAGKTRHSEWNIIPYQKNPALMNRFGDLTAKELGERAQLYEGKFLHYQQAETNTSIREGWFYRDDTDQGVRSADDVFDMYERSVGGNSTFLLNIPPNREGQFSPRDVAALRESGERISATYGHNILSGAKGPKNVLDGNMDTYVLLENTKTIEINTKEPVTINRFVIQESIQTHSERVERHTMEAWINDEWKEIATGTNIGYKRILRFPEVSSDRFRFRVTAERYTPAISTISAHYYKMRPPQLEVKSDVNGAITIQLKQHKFGWKQHGEDFLSNLNKGLEIRYTTDGSIPTHASELYTGTFNFSSGIVHACAFDNDIAGPLTKAFIGLVKTDWKLLSASSNVADNNGKQAFDGSVNTFWQSKPNEHHSNLAIDLGAIYTINGFMYTPPLDNKEGMIEKGVLKISFDGRTWQAVETFEFGNLINDPSPRRHFFDKPVKTKYIRIETIETAQGSSSSAIAEIDLL